MEHCELKWDDIVTPVNVDELHRLLRLSGYDQEKTVKLVQQFKWGFDIGYRGPMNSRHESSNIPLRVGSSVDRWNKIMKEVKAKHYAGPYSQPPFHYYIQSPVDLVPKAGNRTRLIFHLSFDFGEEWNERSINYHTPDELCTVRYNDIDHAVRTGLSILSRCEKSQLFFAKSDFSNAFRILPGLVRHRCLLVMRVRHPLTDKMWLFHRLSVYHSVLVLAVHISSHSQMP